MNRRKFFFSAASVALAGALPASVAATVLAPRPAGASLPWQSLADCRADCGARYGIRGPKEGAVILEDVRSASSLNRDKQFVAIFRGPQDAPEGLYEIESEQGRTLLFLQPVDGRPGTLKAVFSLI